MQAFESRNNITRQALPVNVAPGSAKLSVRRLNRPEPPQQQQQQQPAETTTLQQLSNLRQQQERHVQLSQQAPKHNLHSTPTPSSRGLLQKQQQRNDSSDDLSSSSIRLTSNVTSTGPASEDDWLKLLAATDLNDKPTATAAADTEAQAQSLAAAEATVAIAGTSNTSQLPPTIVHTCC